VMANPRFTKITEGIEVRESWPGGPLREFAKVRPHGHWGLNVDSTEYPFAGSYVCGQCRETTEGVYSMPVAAKCTARTQGIGYLCAACKDMAASAA
jgi:hypothetical protein